MSFNGPRKLIIFGLGEIAELAWYYFTRDSDFEVVAFCADSEFIKEDHFQGLPVATFEEVAARMPPTIHSMFIALGYAKLNAVRADKYRAAKERGYLLPTYISSRSVTWDGLAVGDNCFILENQTIQPFCTIGNNVTLWSGNHIGHHSTIADHAFLASHIVISGNCRIGERCFIGVNATFRDGCTLGEDCFVGMAATVTAANISPGSVIVTDGDDVIAATDRRARVLKRKYFGLEG